MTTTEFILASRTVNTQKGEKTIVTTTTGAEIWLPKSQFDTTAEQITYDALKKGDKVIAVKDAPKDSLKTYKKGDTIELGNDNNVFKGFSKQIVKKHDTLSIMDYLLSKGVTPTFALAS